jgi:uncharacterized protein YhhL (DUF1145 family)
MRVSPAFKPIPHSPLKTELIMKTVTIIFWLISAVAFTGLIPEPAAFWLKAIAIMLLLIHLIEFFAFQKAIKAKNDSGAKSFFMTMVFGVVYFKF